jgi:hypothetical protein
VFIRTGGIAKSSQVYPDKPHGEIKSKHLNFNLKSRPNRCSIDPAIELSYGNPGEEKRLPLSTKPNSSSNPEIRELKMRSATAKLMKNILWLGWPHLTKKIQSKKPRPSTPPSQSVLAAGKMSS